MQIWEGMIEFYKEELEETERAEKEALQVLFPPNPGKWSIG